MPLPTEQLPANVLDALQRGSSIEAIKLLRASTGVGLKEAKNAIDQYVRGHPVRTATVASLISLPLAVVAALRQGNKIEAIRLLRERTNPGLKETRDTVESFQNGTHTEASNLAPGEVPRSSGGIWAFVALVVAALLGYYLYTHSR